MSDEATELFRAALEEHVRGMSDSEFQGLVARTRPPDSTNSADPAVRMRTMTARIAAEQRKRRPVDANGYPLKEGSK
jgi:hypothetical protein